MNFSQLLVPAATYMLSRNSNPMLLSKKRAVILETFFVYFTQDKRLEMCHTCKDGGRRTADPAESKLKTFCYDTNGAYQHIMAQFIYCSHCENSYLKYVYYGCAHLEFEYLK